MGHSHAFPPSQSMALPALPAGPPNSQTGSLVNFNLSTIFPSLGGPELGGPAGNCQLKPGLASSVLPGSMEFPRPGQLATPDLLPHSISLLGHSSQVLTVAVVCLVLHCLV